MKLGVLLPTFQDSADKALETAHAAHAAGLDGVFAYDHLFPIGSPERPTLAPMPVLALVASRTPLVVGTLVARVALVGVAQLIEQFRTLGEIAPGRVIAALGTGDKLSKPEHDAYGLDYPSDDERQERLGEVAIALREQMPVWIGAGARSTNEIAREYGVALNLWGVEPSRVASEARAGEVTWAGQLEGDVASTLRALEAAGATWAVAGTPAPIEDLKRWRQSK
ncbi:MAG TPA: LLM class flavin-dependent oxidoreductase [Acidimicrobiales bacterium]|jgi:alkanesulfonate monooxygenase SsuD/methylene tetrahydromethanopterin reductase-like flavin-dependent oxidoreductase (luciferase family)